MNALPKHLLGAMAAFAVIGLLGGGIWYWTSTQLDTAIQSRAQLMQELSTLNTKGIFPSSANLKTLQDNQEAAATLLSSMEPRLLAAQEELAPFLGTQGKGLSADAWKQLLIEKREELKKQAEAAKAQVADDFYFGFKRYRLASPPSGATRELGIQLAAIDGISRVLFASRIAALQEIRRVLVEESGANLASSGSEEVLAAVVATGGGGLYKVYPFEVRFLATPAAFMRVLSGLSTEKKFYIVRFATVENQKTGVPRRSEILSQSSRIASFGGEGGERPSAAAKLLIPVLGQELLNVRLRVDFIHWSPPASTPASTPKPKPGT